MLTHPPQVLAVDLLNPTPQAEARKHKLKVRLHFTLTYRYILLTLYLDACSRPPILLHGRQVPRLLHHHHRLLARTNRRRLRRVLTGPLPADRRQSKTHRGLLVPEKVDGRRTQ